MVELAKDTPTAEAENTHPDDPQQTGSGSASALGGGAAPAQSAYDMSHGQEEYPGPSAGGEAQKTGEEPHGTV